MTLINQRLQEIGLRKRRLKMLFKNSYRKSKGLIKSARGNKLSKGWNRREQWMSREPLRLRPFIKSGCELSSNRILKTLCRVQLRARQRAKQMQQVKMLIQRQLHQLLLLLLFHILKRMSLQNTWLQIAFLTAQKMWIYREQVERIPKRSCRIARTNKCLITLIQAKKEKSKFRAKR